MGMFKTLNVIENNNKAMNEREDNIIRGMRR